LIEKESKDQGCICFVTPDIDSVENHSIPFLLIEKKPKDQGCICFVTTDIDSAEKSETRCAQTTDFLNRCILSFV